MEVVGIRGAPQKTLAVLKEALKGVDFPEASVTYITDWQDQRARARYAIFVRQGKHRVLSLDAFGPRFGVLGDEALREITLWFLERGVTDFKEAVIAPSEYAALFVMEDQELEKLLAATANPTDPMLYVKRAFTSRM
ncbi:DUF3197 domain-containing protein [Meiothermus sp.]|jgi:hypothetical protein|uniref:DUF3197 domain-containing protein n=1 Tax=Meiothermus sp. TaxID=1955249 RepID=UPI0021DE06C0|nr:DUF3197 domain-containing protein [Meiothermus sp.]GIW25740.1 MAG: hypothetical protein KatS3mg069_2007 [Meiothermus sp.]